MTQPAKPGDPTPARLGDETDYFEAANYFGRERFFSDQTPEKKEKSE
ncbi:hypothetical protein [Rhizobium laguerreae]|nr:hypothetical protein [Rhizobium laguerreae]